MSIQNVSSSIISSQWKYDVFLSSSNQGTCKNFTNHLNAALTRKWINVFRNNNELKRGKSIELESFEAIEKSRFSIIVFSKTYAFSTSCLEELVKIIEYKHTSDERMIFPIFYDVKPTMVRKQTGDFKEAFVKYEETFRQDVEKVQKWKDSLKEVANISGWELEERNELKLIEHIVKEVSSKLIPKKLKIYKKLVGINSRLDKLTPFLDKRSYDVRMVGIWGMGGVGKTTIARIIYDLISWQFEGSSFLVISKNNNLVSLQNNLLDNLNIKRANNSIHNVYEGIKMIGSRLRHKKVLIVIDNVVELKQLESLAGNCDWFGSGSRIIITSSDAHLMKTHGVDDDQLYELERLNGDEAHKLFCMEAFKPDDPKENFEHLTERFVQYAAGLPLVLRIFGSSLHGETVEKWKSALQRLERDYMPEKIHKKLQISFHGLEKRYQKIFLDIACLYKTKDKDYVVKILESCDFNPIIGLSVLREKSLVFVTHDNKLWMHDLLQEMGQQIVKSESEEPGERSRLWEEEDIRHVLSKNSGTEAVEAISSSVNTQFQETIKLPGRQAIENIGDDCLPDTHLANMDLSAKVFLKMINLRLLKICYMKFPEGLEYLPNELRFLEWTGYPLKYLPPKFHPYNIVALHMCWSSIEQLWIGIKHLKYMKSIRLSHSWNLVKTPDFSGVPNLEELELEDCIKLHEIHSSLLIHKKLLELNLKHCTSLESLPRSIKMDSLRKLALSGCSKLKKFPEILRGTKCLSELLLDGTDIKELPLSLQHLPKLVLLNLENCKKLESLPSQVINGLKHLKTLNLSGCSRLEIVPENMEKVESLEELNISGTTVRQPAEPSIFLLRSLKALSFRGCKGTAAATSWFSWLSISRSLDPLGLILPSLSGLSSLKKLDLSDCNLGEGAIPIDICSLFSLEELNLSKNEFSSLPENISHLSKLKSLKMVHCKRLQSPPKLPCSINEVRVDGCVSLETLSDALKSCNSQWIEINCLSCLKLASDNDLAYSMLKGSLEVQAESNPRQKISMVNPGSKIPEWFRCKNEGSSITLTRPSDSHCDRSNLVGYAVCSVFRLHKYPQRVNIRPLFPLDELQCHMEADERKSFSSYGIDFDEDQLGEPAPDHLWLFYMSNQNLHDLGWNFDSNQVKLSFDSLGGERLELKSCGVHPVYVNGFIVESKTDVATSEESTTEYDGAAEDEEPKRD